MAHEPNEAGTGPLGGFGGVAHRAWLAIGAVAVLAGAVPAVIGGVSFALGYLTTWFEAALVLLLAGSVGLNAYLLSKRRISRRRVVAAKHAAEAERRWVSKPPDLGTLVADQSLLESCCTAALRVAQREVGPNPQIALSTIALSRGNFALWMDGWSREAGKIFGVQSRGPGDEDVWVFNVFRRADVQSRPEPAVPLWRTDGTWRDLVLKSWAREQPFEGSVGLTVRVDNGRPYWKIGYSRQPTPDGHQYPDVHYRLGANGELEIA